MKLKNGFVWYLKNEKILSVIKKLEIGKEFTYAILKGGTRLTIIALFLTFLFGYEYWYFLIWFLLGTMILTSG